MQEAENKLSKIESWFFLQKEKLEKNVGVLVVFFLLCFWLGLFLYQHVNLVNIDLGRHIENGEFFLKHFKVPDTNLYSYTYPDVPFVNHHWGSGVLFYLIWKISGFSGLSFFYIGLSLLTFGILFFFTKKTAGLFWATFASIIVIPLIGERTEVRPEVFSYFFSIIFFVLLWRYKEGKIFSKALFVLPIMAFFWVNMHIYFIFGLGIIGLFLLDTLFKKEWNKFKVLTTVFFLTILTSLLNPFGIKGLTYPLNIFRNYGYRVLENQSVSFLDKLGTINNPNLIIIKIALILLFLTTCFLFVMNRKKIHWPLFGLSCTVAILGWSALRNFSLFGYFALPALAYNLKYGVEERNKFDANTVKTVAFFVGCLVFLFFNFLFKQELARKDVNNFSAIESGSRASADFFKENKLQGPIFNDYDIGSFLIFHLFPQEKVFVDNRPEAYPDSFFQDVYIPMQENDDAWERFSDEYNFNVIYFYSNDLTNWGQNFLVSRIRDPKWAPVFADEYAIIFLRRNEKNKDLIDRFEVPSERFRVTTF